MSLRLLDRRWRSFGTLNEPKNCDAKGNVRFECLGTVPNQECRSNRCGKRSFPFGSTLNRALAVNLAAWR